MSNLQSVEAPTFLDTPQTWLETLGEAQPLHCTLPTQGAPNELAACDKVAAALGLKLLPWQRLFLRTITEKLPNGAYRYPVAVLTVARQAGKSTVLKVLSCTRALLYPQYRTYYTAQTNKDAYEHIILEFWKQIEPSVFGKKCTVRRGATSPKINFPNGSFIAPFVPSPDGVHGRNFQLAILDEVFAWDEVQGNGVLGAVQPAQITHKDKQLLMLSTKGHLGSAFLNSWLKKGQLAVNDPDSKLAYFEWAMSADKDPYDMSNYGFHPGVGHLIELDDIAALSESLTRGEFRRSMANQLTETVESVLDVAKWNALKGTLSTPKRSEIAISYEVSYSRDKAAVVAAWRDGKTTQCKVLRTDTGTAWLAPLLTELHAAHPLAIGTDAYSQNQLIADELNADVPELNLRMLKPADFKTGCVSLKARIEDGTIRHDGHLGLKSAIATAQSRPMGSEGWVFSHKSEPELIALTVAARLLDEVKAEVEPVFYVYED